MNKEQAVIVILPLLLMGVGCSQHQSGELTETSSQAKYTVYGKDIYKESTYAQSFTIVDSAFLYKSDSLPKDVVVGNNTITIKEVIIKRENLGFYLIVEYQGSEDKIGFTKSGIGVLSMPIKKWTEEPSQEEKSKDIVEISYLHSIVLLEVDYNQDTGDWNYFKMGNRLYKERVPPNEDEENVE